MPGYPCCCEQIPCTCDYCTGEGGRAPCCIGVNVSSLGGDMGVGCGVFNGCYELLINQDSETWILDPRSGPDANILCQWSSADVPENDFGITDIVLNLELELRGAEYVPIPYIYFQSRTDPESHPYIEFAVPPEEDTNCDSEFGFEHMQIAGDCMTWEGTYFCVANLRQGDPYDPDYLDCHFPSSAKAEIASVTEEYGCPCEDPECAAACTGEVLPDSLLLTVSGIAEYGGGRGCEDGSFCANDMNGSFALEYMYGCWWRYTMCVCPTLQGDCPVCGTGECVRPASINARIGIDDVTGNAKVSVYWYNCPTSVEELLGAPSGSAQSYTYIHSSSEIDCSTLDVTLDPPDDDPSFCCDHSGGSIRVQAV